MNVLMMTLMYPQDQMDEISRNVKDKLQNQINNYQHAFVEGIRANLNEGEHLHLLNALPVGIYPLQYRQLWLRAGLHDNGAIHQLGCLNLPWFKQKCRAIGAEMAVRQWVKCDPQNRTVLVYTQYLPYMQALAKVKNEYPDLKVAVIVTDLPNELGLSSGRTGLMKALETHMGRRSLDLLRQMDGFVLLTEPMAYALQVRSKPCTVIEGLILADAALPADDPTNERPVFLYTGTLEAELGVGEMLRAFAQMPEYDLWICGYGCMRQEIEEYASKYSNIRFFGFVPQKEALALQASATALVNPRQPSGLFTRYSFPSKTLEYMRSGKPVLCCRLEGIPSDYDPYLNYMGAGEEGIMQAVRSLMALSAEERAERGNAARAYVLQCKNPKKQCEKLLKLLRSL